MGNTSTKQCNCESVPVQSESAVVLNTPAVVSNEPTSNDTNKYSNFEQNILNFHNNARRANGLQPLVWDSALQQKAADWNNYIKGENELAQCNKMRHPGTGPDGSQEEIGIYLPDGNGQNLYRSHGSRSDGQGGYQPWDPSSPQEAVRKWYDECTMWKSPSEGQDVPERFSEVGHLTQMLWKSATRVGCSYIPCREEVPVNGVLRETGGHIINCHYDRGNVSGQFGTEVPSNPVCDLSGNQWLLNAPPASSTEG